MGGDLRWDDGAKVETQVVREKGLRGGGESSRGGIKRKASREEKQDVLLLVANMVRVIAAHVKVGAEESD